MAQDLDRSKVVLYKGQCFSLERSNAFDRWLKKLRDREGRLRILKRL